MIILLFLLAYLLGSIPTAVWVSKKYYGFDIREVGSGNAGATNAFRVLGTKTGVLVLFVDMLKGALAVKLAYLSSYAFGSIAFTNLQIGLGLLAVVGHIFPVFAQFKGGKGIATLFGLILGIQPIVALSLVAVFLFILVLTKYVSVSSMIASIAFPIMILFVFKEPELSYRLFAVATALLVILTHHKNIQRLIKGCENKVNLFKKKDSDANR